MRRFATPWPRRIASAPSCLLRLLSLLALAGLLCFGVRPALAQNVPQASAPVTPLAIGPASSSAPSPAGVQIALEGAGLADFLRFMGQFLGQPPVFREDQIPQAKVTILARRALAPAELRELFDLVLQAAGLQAARRGEVLYVLPAPTSSAPTFSTPRPSAAPSALVARRAPGPPLPPDAHILARVLSARATPGTVNSLVEAFDGLRTDRGQVLGSHGVRAVLLADGQARVAQLSPVLEAVATTADSLAADSLAADFLGGAGQDGLRAEVLPLRRTSSRLAVKKIEMQLRGQPGPAAPAVPLVISLDWSNSLLLAGDAQGLAQARRLAAQLDDAGREAPALRAFRTRHIRPEKLAEAIAALPGAGAQPEAAAGGEAQGFGQVRVRVDAEAGAVLVLASPEVMARLERLAEDLDQPRPRVYIEALVAELPPELERELSVLALPPAPSVPMGAQASAPVVVNPAGQGRPFALAEIGGAAVFRGRAAEAPQYGLDSLAALIGADGRARVLAQPRVAVPDGGEARVSDGPGAQVQAGRLRMTLSPRVEQGTGRVEVTVSVQDAQYPGQTQSATALLGEGQVLLLLSGVALPVKPARSESTRSESGWTLFSPGASQGKSPGRLGIVLSARVVRPARPGPSAPASPASVAPARGVSANP